VDRPAPLISHASPLFSPPAKRDQIPRPIRHRRLLSKNIEIPVIGSNVVEDVLRAVPLIEHGFDLILPSSKPEPNGPFIGLSARVTFHA